MTRENRTHIFNDLTILMIQICKQYKLSIQKVSGCEENILEYVSKIEHLDVCRSFFEGLFDHLISEINLQSEKRKYSIYTQRAIDFIQEHYKEDVAQSEIADYLGISSAYLSTIFKQETGIGCKEYLLNLKMDYAKQKIDEGIKLKEIVEELGFTNYPYFFKLFKKKYGITPKSYMKNSADN